MSLRPPLHVSTFQSRTVVSMFGRLCHLFVHELSSLQVANAQCMTLRSLLLLVFAQRAKNTGSQQEKKHRNGKNTFGSRKKTPCSGKKLFPQREKNASKKCRFAAGKIQSSRKTPCSSTKAPLQQKKCILEAAGKNRPRREKTRPRQEKNRPRQEKNQQQRKSSFATQKVAATEKNTFPQREKAAALCSVLCRFC